MEIKINADTEKISQPPTVFNDDLSAGSARLKHFDGEIVGFGNDIFKKDNGIVGLWDPATFVENFGINIFFLEEYSSNKIPVLFIHGAGGTPTNWKTIIDNLDRKKYQPWVLYYPSGLRFNGLAEILYGKLQELQHQYQFNSLKLVAHSMGGLLSRSFLNFYNQEKEVAYKIDTFVAISTPWGGHSYASFGNIMSPVRIPSWKDVGAYNAFIKGLYKTKIEPPTKFYLLYGLKKRGSKVFTGPNDGTIALESLTDKRAVAEASGEYKFNSGHAEILQNIEAIKDLDEILDGKIPPANH